MKKILGKSWLGWLNRLLLQWFFVRLAINPTTGKYSILRWVVPTTGWSTDYKFIFRKKNERTN